MVTIDIDSNVFSKSKNKISFKITNHFEKNIWLNTDNIVVWNDHQNVSTLSFAREKVLEGVSLFDYYFPHLTLIKPLDTIIQTNTFNWPFPLNTIWNKKALLDLSQGHHELIAKFGFGFSPKIRLQKNSEVEASVLVWQQCVYSEKFSMYVQK